MPTANQKTERYFNEFYSAMFTEQETVDQLEYLTVKSRGIHTTEKTIRHYYRNNMIGILIRKYDITAFECEKSDRNFNR